GVGRRWKRPTYSHPWHTRRTESGRICTSALHFAVLQRRLHDLRPARRTASSRLKACKLATLSATVDVWTTRWGKLWELSCKVGGTGLPCTVLAETWVAGLLPPSHPGLTFLLS